MDSDDIPSTSAKSKQCRGRQIDPDKNPAVYPITFEEFLKYVKVEEYIVRELKKAGPDLYKRKYKNRHKLFPLVYKLFYQDEEQRTKLFRCGLKIKPIPNFAKNRLMQMPVAAAQTALGKPSTKTAIEKSETTNVQKKKTTSDSADKLDTKQNNNCLDSKTEKKQSVANMKSVSKTPKKALNITPNNCRKKCKPLDIDSHKITNFFAAIELERKLEQGKNTKSKDRKRKSNSASDSSAPVIKRGRELRTRRKVRLDSKDFVSDDSDIQSDAAVVNLTESKLGDDPKSPERNAVNSKLPRRNTTVQQQVQEKSRNQLSERCKSSSDADMALLSLSGMNNDRMAAPSTDINAWLEKGMKALEDDKSVEPVISKFENEEYCLISGLEAIKNYPNQLKLYIRYLLNLEIQKRDGPLSMKLLGVRIKHDFPVPAYIESAFLKMSFDEYQCLINAEELTTKELADGKPIENIKSALQTQYINIVKKKRWPSNMHFKISALKDLLERKGYQDPMKIEDIPPGLLIFEDILQQTNIKECMRARSGKPPNSDNHLLELCRESFENCLKAARWDEIEGIKLINHATVKDCETVSENSAEVIPELMSMPSLSVNSSDLVMKQNSTKNPKKVVDTSLRLKDVESNLETISKGTQEQSRSFGTLERNLEDIFRETQEQSNSPLNVDDKMITPNNNPKNYPSVVQEISQTSLELRATLEVNVTETAEPNEALRDSLMGKKHLRELSDKLTLQSKEPSKFLKISENIPPSPNLFQSSGESDPKMSQPQQLVVSSPEAVYMQLENSVNPQTQDYLTSDPFADIITQLFGTDVTIANSVPLLCKNDIKLEPLSMSHTAEESFENSCQILDIPPSEPIVIDEEETTPELLETLLGRPAKSTKPQPPVVNTSLLSSCNSLLDIIPQRLPSNLDLIQSQLNSSQPPEDVSKPQTLERDKECTKKCDDKYFETKQEVLSELIDSNFVLSIFNTESEEPIDNPENEKRTLQEIGRTDSLVEGRQSPNLEKLHESKDSNYDPENETNIPQETGTNKNMVHSSMGLVPEIPPYRESDASVEQSYVSIAPQTLHSVIEMTQSRINKSLVAEKSQGNVSIPSLDSEVRSSDPVNYVCLVEEIQNVEMASSQKEANASPEGGNTQESLITAYDRCTQDEDVTDDVAMDKTSIISTTEVEHCLQSSGTNLKSQMREAPSQSEKPSESERATSVKNVEVTASSEHKSEQTISSSFTYDVHSEDCSNCSSDLILVEDESDVELTDDDKVGQLESTTLVDGLNKGDCRKTEHFQGNLESSEAKKETNVHLLDSTVGKEVSSSAEFQHILNKSQIIKTANESCPMKDVMETENVSLNVSSSNDDQSVVECDGIDSSSESMCRDNFYNEEICTLASTSGKGHTIDRQSLDKRKDELTNNTKMADDKREDISSSVGVIIVNKIISQPNAPTSSDNTEPMDVCQEEHIVQSEEVESNEDFLSAGKYTDVMDTAYDSSEANNAKSFQLITEMGNNVVSSVNVQHGNAFKDNSNENEFDTTAVLPSLNRKVDKAELHTFSKDTNSNIYFISGISNPSETPHQNDIEMIEVPQMVDEPKLCISSDKLVPNRTDVSCFDAGLPSLMPDNTCIAETVTETNFDNIRQNRQNTNEVPNNLAKAAKEASKVISYGQIKNHKESHPGNAAQTSQTATREAIRDSEAIPGRVSYDALMNAAFGTDERDSDNDSQDFVKVPFSINRQNLKSFLLNYIGVQLQQSVGKLSPPKMQLKFNLVPCYVNSKTNSEHAEEIIGNPRSVGSEAQLSPIIQRCQFDKTSITQFLRCDAHVTNTHSGDISSQAQSETILEPPESHLLKIKNKEESEKANVESLQRDNCSTSSRCTVQTSKTQTKVKLLIAKNKIKKPTLRTNLKKQPEPVPQKTHNFRSLPLGTEKKKSAASDDISNESPATVLEGDINIEDPPQGVVASTASQILGTDCTYFESSQLLRNIGECCPPEQNPVTCNEDHHAQPEPKVNLNNQITMSEGLMARKVWTINLQWKPNDKMAIEMRCIVNNRWILVCDESAKLMFNLSPATWSDVRMILREIDHFEYRRMEARSIRVKTPLHNVLRSLFDSAAKVVNVKLIDDSHSPFARCETATPLYRKPFQCMTKAISANVLRRMRDMKENLQNNSA